MESKYTIPTKRVIIPEPIDLSSSKLFPELNSCAGSECTSPNASSPKMSMNYKKVVSTACASKPQEVEVSTVLVSLPYCKLRVVDMTTADMRLFKYASALASWEEEQSTTKSLQPVIDLDYGYDDEMEYITNNYNEGNSYYEDDDFGDDDYDYTHKTQEENDTYIINYGDLPW